MAEQTTTTATTNSSSSNTAHAPSGSDSDSDGDGRAHKPYIMSQELFDALTSKGFSANAAKKSIVAGCIDEATCTQWIRMHDGHAELDTPLADGVEVVVRAKRVLSDEERAAAVRAMQEKIARKKAEAKAEEQRKELERIEFGRKALEARAKVDEVRRELELKQVRAQKQADAEARRRVKIQIIADRYVRQGKTSTDAWQAAEAEYDAAACKERIEAAARLQTNNRSNDSDGQAQLPPSVAATAAAAHMSSAAAATTTTTTSSSEQQQQQPQQQWNLAALVDARASDAVSTQLQRIFAAPTHNNKNNNSDDTDAITTAVLAHIAAMHAAPPALAEASVSTVRGILARIRDSPFDAKLRSLKTTTKAFTQKLLPVPAALQLLQLCNFDLHTDEETGAQSLQCTTVVMRTLDTVLELLDATTIAA